MTNEQIANWRKIIFQILEGKCKGAGAYALIMPKEEIEKYRDELQEQVNNLKPEKRNEKINSIDY